LSIRFPRRQTISSAQYHKTYKDENDEDCEDKTLIFGSSELIVAIVAPWATAAVLRCCCPTPIQFNLNAAKNEFLDPHFF